MDLAAAIASSEGLALTAVRVSFASAATTAATGVVLKPETINYRTFAPERSGLFCEAIFGEIRACPCGLEPKEDTRKRDVAAGKTCGVCGGRAPLAPDRRRRFGHIALALPVVHPWLREQMAAAVGISRETLEQVLYGERWIVVLDGATHPRGTVLGEEAWYALSEELGADAGATGAAAISTLLGGHRAILQAIPVLPPHLRPMVPLSGGRLSTSDVTDLYRRVINRNNRLRRLLELNAPEIIIRNETRMLQEAVEALFDNRRQGRIVTGPDRRALRSLADMAGGFAALGATLAEIDGAIASGEITLARPLKFHRKLAALRALGLVFEPVR